MGGMIDNDFIDDDENDFSAQDLSKEKPDRLHVETELDLEKDPEPKKEEPSDLEIEVVSDVPDEDKGKRVAKDDDDLVEPDDEEKRQFGKKTRKRIDELVSQAHAERRRAEEYQRQLEAAVEYNRKLVTRANSLSDVVEGGEKALLEEHQNRLKSDMDKAKRQYAEAHEAGDVNGMTAAQEAMAKVAADLSHVSRYRPTTLKREEEFKPQITERPPVEETTQKWQEKNTWFGRDDRMTAYALMVHNDLVNNKGVKLASPDYWKSIDTEMRQRFPEKFEEAPRRRQPIVAPATRNAGAEVRRVTLTESQVKLARKLGLTPEQYAREMVRLNQGR